MALSVDAVGTPADSTRRLSAARMDRSKFKNPNAGQPTRPAGMKPQLNVTQAMGQTGQRQVGMSPTGGRPMSPAWSASYGGQQGQQSIGQSPTGGKPSGGVQLGPQQLPGNWNPGPWNPETQPNSVFTKQYNQYVAGGMDPARARQIVTQQTQQTMSNPEAGMNGQVGQSPTGPRPMAPQYGTGSTQGGYGQQAQGGGQYPGSTNWWQQAAQAPQSQANYGSSQFNYGGGYAPSGYSAQGPYNQQGQGYGQSSMPSYQGQSFQNTAYPQLAQTNYQRQLANYMPQPYAQQYNFENAANGLGIMGQVQSGSMFPGYGSAWGPTQAGQYHMGSGVNWGALNQGGSQQQAPQFNMGQGNSQQVKPRYGFQQAPSGGYIRY